MNNDVIKKLQIKNGKLQVQIERLKLDKEEYYLDYLELHDRIGKAIEILKLCNSKCSKEVIDILRGENNEEKI